MILKGLIVMPNAQQGLQEWIRLFLHGLSTKQGVISNENCTRKLGTGCRLIKMRSRSLGNAVNGMRKYWAKGSHPPKYWDKRINII